jgi:uncharacterized OB-fold protein
MSAGKPLPHPNAVTQRFWSSCAEGKLEFQVCQSCGKRQLPPRAACVSCHGAALDWQVASGRATVYSFTVVHRAPLEAFKADVPYVIAIVELEEGVRAMMNIRTSDPNAVAIGQPVEIFFEPTGPDTPPLPQARPRS